MASPRTTRRGGKLLFHPDNGPISEALDAQKPTTTCHLFQVNWRKAHFEKFKCSIVEFAKDLIHINDVRGLSVTHESVRVYWKLLVWSVYGEGNSTCTTLESQASPNRVLTL